MFTKSLTIVLPVHNAESRLRKNVGELLELASELTAKFGVLIIDDGSTDSTFEVAEELAAHYPQVSVRRHRQCRGLGAAIEYVHRRVRSDAVIMHDGVTPINSQQVRNLWRRWIDQAAAPGDQRLASIEPSHDLSDLANLSDAHAAMERAHRQVIGFHLMTPPRDEAFTPAETTTAPRSSSRSDPGVPRRSNLGTIPRLPRPKFLSALAEFAWGE